MNSSKKKIKEFLSLILIISLIFILSGCKKNKSEDVSLEEKVNTEISYIDSEIIGILNALNNIDYAKYKVVEKEEEGSSGKKEGSQSGSGSKQSSEDRNSQESGGSSEEGAGEGKQEGGSQSSDKSGNESQSLNTSNKIFSMQANNILGSQSSQVDWNQLKNKVESLYTTWTTVSIDLRELKIPEEELSKFAEKMDSLAFAIKTESKEETLKNATELYAFFPGFAEQYSSDEKVKNVLQTKYNLLICYKNADSENWEELQKSLTDLKMNFSNVSSQKDKYKGKTVNINNASVIINEMNDSVSVKDKDIFLIKYKNLIQELNVILSI